MQAGEMGLAGGLSRANHRVRTEVVVPPIAVAGWESRCMCILRWARPIPPGCLSA